MANDGIYPFIGTKVFVYLIDWDESIMGCGFDRATHKQAYDMHSYAMSYTGSDNLI